MDAHSVVADYVAGLPGTTDSDPYAADDTTITAVWLDVLVFVASVTVFLTCRGGHGTPADAPGLTGSARSGHRTETSPGR